MEALHLLDSARHFLALISMTVAHPQQCLYHPKTETRLCHILAESTLGEQSWFQTECSKRHGGVKKIPRAKLS